MGDGLSVTGCMFEDMFSSGPVPSVVFKGSTACR